MIVISSGCRNLVTDANDPPPYPEPVPAFQELKISDPSVGDIWRYGREYQIKWDAVHHISKVNLILLKKKQYNRHVIKSDLPNTGFFRWTVPADIPASVSYQVRLENADNPGEYYYSEVFRIAGN